MTKSLRNMPIDELPDKTLVMFLVQHASSAGAAGARLALGNLTPEQRESTESGQTASRKLANYYYHEILRRLEAVKENQ